MGSFDQAANPGLFDGVLAKGSVPAAVSDRAWLQAMLDFEAALARSRSELGELEPAVAEAIAAVCEARRYDVAAIGTEAAAFGNPAAPLVAAIRREAGEAGGEVHRGATSQDVVDTAAMLVAKRALAPLITDLDDSADATAELARAHRSTPIVGRTLMQQAVPTTFGLKASGWMVALDEAAARLRHVRDRLPVQLGGAAGTLAAYGDGGSAVLAGMAGRLDLAEPVIPWHTNRSIIAELATAIAIAAGVISKVAGDVILLAQSEVSELRETVEGPAEGRSSSMPQKRNPIAAISAIGTARAAPGLVANLLATMDHQHERAAGAWHAEWAPLRSLLVAGGSAAAWLRESLGRIEVDDARMQQNLADAGGAPLAERLAAALAARVGSESADAAIARVVAAAGPLHDFAAQLAIDPVVSGSLEPTELDALLEPTGYLGSATGFVDRALEAHAEAVVLRDRR